MSSLAQSPSSISVLGSKIVGRLRKGLYRHAPRFGLRRVLSEEWEAPRAKIPIHVRPFEPGDEEALFGHRHGEIAPADAVEVNSRLRHIEADIPTAYVAVDESTGTPCYIQWLMGADQNDRIQTHLWGLPRLARNEALLENAYIPPDYRGQRVMPEAMYKIAEKARDLGADYTLTFVPEGNMASLKGCKRAGFDIYSVHDHREYVFGIVQRHTFNVLPKGDPRLSLLAVS